MHGEGLLTTFDWAARCSGRWDGGGGAGRQAGLCRACGVGGARQTPRELSARRWAETQAGTHVTGIEVAFQVSVPWENREQEEGTQHFMT